MSSPFTTPPHAPAPRQAAAPLRRRLPDASLLVCAALFLGGAWYLSRPGSPLRQEETSLPPATAPLSAPAPAPLSPTAESARMPDPAAVRERELRALVARGVSTWSLDDYGRTTHAEFIALYPAWLREDLVAASRAVLGLPADWDKNEFLSLATDAWLARHPAQAALYAESLDDDAALQSDAFLRVASAWADRDPATASAWIEKQLDSPGADRAAGELARRWAEREPAAALAWAETLPAGPVRDRARLRAATAWVRQDQAAAVRHFEALPQDRQNDPVRVALSRASLEDDPGSAVLWARAVDDPALRRSALIDTLAPLARVDPPAARSLASELGLGPEALAALRGR